MSSSISRGVWYQVLFWILAIVTTVLLAIGWWPVAILCGIAAVAAIFLVRRGVVSERVDEVLSAEDENRSKDEDR